MEDKEILRREMRARRDDFHHRHFASAQINARLLAWLNAANFSLQRVAVYLAQDCEPNMDEFARALQTRNIFVFAPHERNARASFTEIASDWSNIQTNARGWREPLEYSRGQAVSADELDAVFLPGLAFDECGNRLGQGGGWYDRALENAPPGVLQVGVCFDFQIVESVPREAHDKSVSIVVTDKRIIEIA